MLTCIAVYSFTHQWVSGEGVCTPSNCLTLSLALCKYLLDLWLYLFSLTLITSFLLFYDFNHVCVCCRHVKGRVYVAVANGSIAVFQRNKGTFYMEDVVLCFYYHNDIHWHFTLTPSVHVIIQQMVRGVWTATTCWSWVQEACQWSGACALWPASTSGVAYATRCMSLTRPSGNSRQVHVYYWQFVVFIFAVELSLNRRGRKGQALSMLTHKAVL